MRTRIESVTSAQQQQSLSKKRETAAYAAFTAIVAALLAANAFVTPNDSLIALVLLMMALVGVFMKPIWGVYTVVIFTLLGDSGTTPWYPFAKNFSSAESVLFVSDEVIANPLEVILVATLCSWLLRAIVEPGWSFRRGRLLIPILVFTCFVLFGLFYGLTRSGNLNVGLWEARPLLYLPLFYVLVTNLARSGARDYERLMWVALASITGQSVLAVEWYLRLPDLARADLQSLTEHSASVHFNAVLVMLLAVFLLPSCTWVARVSISAMAVPVTVAYVLAERRSAFVGLSLGIILLSVFLFRVRRRVFWVFVPAVAVFALAYLVVFWNVGSGIGFPAQAIKSAIAPDS